MPPAKPLEWISRYGSISFSQCGKEFPSAGMNEKGLVMLQMTLPETIYPKANEKPGVNQMQVIQYVLDTCKDVEEVIEGFNDLVITQASWPIHYMVFDKKQNPAIIEFIQGEMVIYQKEALEVRILTNSSYRESLYYLKEGNNQVKNIQDTYKKDSVRRFIKAVDFAKEFKRSKEISIDYAFKSLESVKMEGNTWTLVFDTKNLMVYCTKNFSSIKKFSLKEIEYTNATKPQVLDLSVNLNEETVQEFKAYTREINRELVNSFFRNETTMNVMNIQTPDELLEYLITYPENML